MPTRTISGSVSSGSMKELQDGDNVSFSTTSGATSGVNGVFVSADLYLSNIKTYSSDAYFSVYVGGTHVADTDTFSVNSSTHSETFHLNPTSAASILPYYTVNDVTLYIVATDDANENKANVRDACTFRLDVEYEVIPEKCTAPSNVSLSAASSTGSNVTLSWSPGAGGENNAARHYQIARAESTNGTTWGAMSVYKTNVGNVTSYSVPPPSTPGNYYRYYVRLVGEAGDVYASDWAQCADDLQNPPPEKCTAPSNVSLSATSSTGSNVTLSWSPGAGGENNAASYYMIGRREKTQYGSWGNITVCYTNVGNVTSYSVPPPSAPGNYYRYCVKLIGAAGTAYASDWEDCADDLQNPPIERCTAPSNVHIAYTQGDTVRIEWTKGTGGTHNAASHYQIGREESDNNGRTWSTLEVYEDDIGDVSGYTLPMPTEDDGAYLYHVRLVGDAGEEYASEWEECNRIVYTPTVVQCKPPSDVKLSANASMGDAATLSWSRGYGESLNSFKEYQVRREESEDGVIWGPSEIITATTSLSCSVDPPMTFGNYYRFSVRTMGTAGEEYASEWVMCSELLQKAKAQLMPYTDPTLTPGETHIKAVHILELRTNVDRIRQGFKLNAYGGFSELRAGYTSLSQWKTHVEELRAAIDEIPQEHEPWITITENRPTAAAIEQLRRVVEDA